MKTRKKYFIIVLLIVSTTKLNAQLCQNSVDTIYGLNSILNSSGQIYGINVNNAGTITLGSTPSGSMNANGLGYSKTDGKFYFFNWSGAGGTGPGPTEFISFNPLTGAKTTLAIPSSPALPIASTGKIRSGAVNETGLGYYTIFPGATTAMGYPVTGPAFYYYDITTDTWTLVSQSFKDISGNTVNEIKNLTSGDMAFDGFGRLWMLCSSTTNYALYRINAPMPTSPVASIIVDTIIPITPTPGGVGFTGMAFNSNGYLYLVTSSGLGANNNVLYEMTSPIAPLNVIGTLPDGAGDDIASCITPTSVLPISYFQFSATLKENAIKLLWKIDEDEKVLGYEIEHSINSAQWKKIRFVDKKYPATGSVMAYTDYEFKSGSNYYRIAQLLSNGQKKYSSVQHVVAGGTSNVFIGPNPASDFIRVYNKNDAFKYNVQILDYSGRSVYVGILNQTQSSIDIKNLGKGIYVLKLISQNQDTKPETFKFVKN